MSGFFGTTTPVDQGGSGGFTSNSSIINNLFESAGDKFYRVMITGPDLGNAGTIKCYMPEKFSISSSASYESRFTAGLGSVSPAFQTISNANQALNGVSLVTKKMSLSTWSNSSPVEFQLPLLFNAYSDPLAEVHTPLAMLLALTRPSDTDTPLSASASSALGQAANATGALTQSAGGYLNQKLIRGPGPTYAEPDRGTYTLTIGNIAIFYHMIIVSVNVEMDSLITKDGYCISAQADVTVMSSTMMLREDMMSSFKSGIPSGSINANNSNPAANVGMGFGAAP